jgi:hypothetical protein
VSSCSISNKNHYVNTARRIADEINGNFMNQFENMANYRAHYVGRPFNVCTLHISFYALFVKDPKFGRGECWCLGLQGALWVEVGEGGLGSGSYRGRSVDSSSSLPGGCSNTRGVVWSW